MAGGYTITIILGDSPNSMMNWKYSIISEPSLQCLSRIFFLARKPIFPQELRHFNLPRRAENGITIEARIPERRRGRPTRADVCRARPKGTSARLPCPPPPHQACVLIRCGTPDVIQIRPHRKTDLKKNSI